MRIHRGAIGASVILVLLAGLGGAALAQDQEAPGEAHTGPLQLTWFKWGNVYEPGDMSEDGLSVRDQGWDAYVRADDPRFTGQTWIVLNKDLYDPEPRTKQLSGTIRIENDGGAWAGTMRGHFDSRNRHFNMELIGEGGYAGHAAVLRTVGDGDGTWEGFVFPAPLLEYPDPVEPPTR